MHVYEAHAMLCFYTTENVSLHIMTTNSDDLLLPRAPKLRLVIFKLLSVKLDYMFWYRYTVYILSQKKVIFKGICNHSRCNMGNIYLYILSVLTIMLSLGIETYQKEMFTFLLVVIPRCHL